MPVHPTRAILSPPDTPQPESNSPDDDARALVSRAVRGDVAAFEQLYRRSSGRVYALCLRMSGDPQHARELAHDAFVRAWERLASFRGDAEFDTWMHRLTVNVVLADRRTERRRQQRVTLAEDEPGVSLDAAPARAGRDVLARLDLERAIATLQPGPREVFVLHDVEGYGHDEIARRMGMPAGTVRSMLHRARKSLMNWMEK
jgi:RNA polymerase sigma-70 factor (ECF subfamily)